MTTTRIKYISKKLICENDFLSILNYYTEFIVQLYFISDYWSLRLDDIQRFKSNFINYSYWRIIKLHWLNSNKL